MSSNGADKLVHQTLFSISCSFLWIAVRDNWCRAWGIRAVRPRAQPPSRSLAGWVREFIWQSPRSAPSLIRAVVKKEVMACPSFPLGTAFKMGLYCWPPPMLHRSLAAAVSVTVLYCHNSDPDLDLLTGLPGLTSDLPHHCRLTGWSLDCVWLWWLSFTLILTQTCWFLSQLCVGEVSACACFIILLCSQLPVLCRAASPRCSLTVSKGSGQW